MEEAKFSRVKVRALLSVVSSIPIEPGKVHKLSLLDQAMGLHTAHFILYYRSNPFVNGPMSTDLDNLRNSLSGLLNQYPNVTGRLIRDPDGGWVVKCNDAGVRMLQASVDATLDEWLRSADATEEKDLTAWEDMPHDPSFWSPFRIQMNHFKCGGLGIGLSCTHMQADITSLALLMKSWSEIHKAQPLTHPPIFHLSNNNSSTPAVPDINSTTPPPSKIIKMGSATMKFSGPTIEKCLSKVRNQCPNATPFDVLSALFWSTIARWQKPDDQNKHQISISMDLRSSGTVPYSYFGNAQNFSLLSLEAEELTNGGLDRVSEIIHRQVEGVKGEEFLRGVPDGIRMYGPWLTFINMEHTQPLMYAAAFNEAERPVHVSCHLGNVEGQGLIIVMPSGEGGLSRTVTITLPEEQIDGICKEKIIQDLEPTFLISGRR